MVVFACLKQDSVENIGRSMNSNSVFLCIFQQKKVHHTGYEWALMVKNPPSQDFTQKAVVGCDLERKYLETAA